MIDSRQILIQLGRRQHGGSWSFEQISNPEGVLNIPTIEFNLPVSEIYLGTDF